LLKSGIVAAKYAPDEAEEEQPEKGIASESVAIKITVVVIA